MDSPEPEKDATAKRGPRKTAEIVAETEERMRAEAADEIAALKAQLEEANAKAQAAETALVNHKETAAEQVKLDELTEVSPEDDDAITVNFVSDDVTMLGRIWVRGQELTIKPGTREWDELFDHKRGKSFLQLTEDEQIAMWGERKFRPGHWTGQSFESLLSNPELSEEERAELESILNKRLSRTAAPAGSTTPQKRSPVAYS
jgi:hypothetical protein